MRKLWAGNVGRKAGIAVLIVGLLVMSLPSSLRAQERRLPEPRDYFLEEVLGGSIGAVSGFAGGWYIGVRLELVGFTMRW